MDKSFKSRKTVALSEAIDQAAATPTMRTMQRDIQPLGVLLNASTFARRDGSMARNDSYLSKVG